MISHQKITVILLVVCCFISASESIDPPLLGSSFQIAFDETFIVNTTKYMVNGQMLYDVKSNRQRVDRTNGKYDIFCSSVLPNISTPCTHLTVQNKRYLIYSARRQCCMCCDSAHGCGILRQDWLVDAKYMGTERIIDTDYDKWSKDGSFGFNLFHVTTDDSHIPRRLNEDGTHITDYIVKSYVNKTFSSQFAVPSYCTASCPLTTICGKFTDNKQQKLNLERE